MVDVCILEAGCFIPFPCRIAWHPATLLNFDRSWLMCNLTATIWHRLFHVKYTVKRALSQRILHFSCRFPISPLIVLLFQSRIAPLIIPYILELGKAGEIKPHIGIHCILGPSQDEYQLLAFLHESELTWLKSCQDVFPFAMGETLQSVTLRIVWGCL